MLACGAASGVFFPTESVHLANKLRKLKRLHDLQQSGKLKVSCLYNIVGILLIEVGTLPIKVGILPIKVGILPNEVGMLLFKVGI